MKPFLFPVLLWFVSISLPAQIQFTEISATAGINHAFEIDLATFGGGAAIIDFDRDGFEDLYVTGGKASDALYKNNGDGTFSNVFAQAGFERTAEVYTQGVASADINRDGYKDLIITTMYYLTEKRNLAPNLLYLNNGDGSFTEVTRAWGLEELMSNSQGASFGDVNADGFPDLFIANYFISGPAGVSIYNEQTITNSFSAAPDFLLINLGGQSFVNATEMYGLNHDGFGFEGLFTDIDNDRDLDLLVANDFGFKKTPNLLLRNDYPKRQLKDRAAAQAWNYGMNAMGIAQTDYNFDGWMDYFVTNLSTSLFTVNDGSGHFLDETFAARLALPTIEDSLYFGVPISWGANFFDYDHDTDEDLFVCNGALNPTVRLNPNLFFENVEGRFKEMGADKKLNDPQIGRGSVVFDFDNDGDLDLFVVNQIPRESTTQLPANTARCKLYRNDGEHGNWLKVELQGVHAEKNGMGSRVELMVDGKLLIREIQGGSSHMSHNSTIAHFGLGEATTVESLTVKWIGGNTQTMENVSVNQKIVIEESGSSIFAFNESSLKVYPSPFTDRVVIEYEMDEAAPLTVDILDVQGRLIQRLRELQTPAPTGFMYWEVPRELPAGVYLFRLRTKDQVVSFKGLKY